MNLYEITNQALRQYAEIIENDGEITPEIEEAMKITAENYSEKISDYCKVIADTKGEAESIDAEIKRLTAMKKSRTNLIDNLKARMSESMNVLGKDKVDTGLFKVSFRASKSVAVEDGFGNTIAEKVNDFINTLSDEAAPFLKFEMKVDKMAIKEAIGGGLEIGGAEIVENKSIQIR